MTPKKYPQNFDTPKNIYFSENPKNIEIQKFEPKKMDRAYVWMKKSEYPPPWGGVMPKGWDFGVLGRVKNLSVGICNGATLAAHSS